VKLENSTIHDWVIDCIDLVYPRLCAGCGCTLLTREREVCLICVQELPRTGYQTRLKNNPVYDALTGLLPLAGSAAWVYYEPDSLSQRLIHSMKYKDRPEIATALGRVCVSELSNFLLLPAKTVVIPIPLHPEKLRIRGYNQAGIFAKAIAKGLNLACDEKILQRIRHTESQTGKDRPARRTNMQNAFQVNKPFSSPVLLVDDVATTGATLEAAGAALVKAGVTDIFVLTLACVQAA